MTAFADFTAARNVDQTDQAEALVDAFVANWRSAQCADRTADARRSRSKLARVSEFNLDVAYALSSRWKLGVAVFNLFNSKDDAADYYYTGRLPGEPQEGVTDFQVHPLEPRSVRFTLTAAL